MTTTIVSESHTDHGLPEAVLHAAIAAHDELIAAGNRLGVCITTHTMPGAKVPTQLVRRQDGESVLFGIRGGRGGATPLVLRPGEWTDRVTVVSGPYGEHPRVLYTAHGGESAEREPWDVVTAGERAASERFWAKHALALLPPAPVCMACGDTHAGDRLWPWAGQLDTSWGGDGPCGDLHSWSPSPSSSSPPPLGEVVVNLTPHPVTVGGRTIPPSETVARVSVVPAPAGTFAAIPLTTQQAGEVVGLPAPIPGVLWVVSGMVRAALAAGPDPRLDLVSPGDLVRDVDGRVVGCESLVLSQHPDPTATRAEPCGVCGAPAWLCSPPDLGAPASPECVCGCVRP